MKTGWHKSAAGGLLPLGLICSAWAAEPQLGAAAEGAAQSSPLAIGGLWLGAAAALVVGGLFVFFWVRMRHGSALDGGDASAQAHVDEHMVPVHAATPRGYSPKNVGNDASARPWESSLIGSSLGGAAVWGLPENFDPEAFLAASKANFVSLQGAWDRSDIASLRAMMTDAMLEQIKSQLAAREQSSGGAPNTTEVVMLEAHLLGIEELASEFVASVEFSGMLREDPASGPNPFREVWSIVRSKEGGGGWLVSGVQALQ